MVVDSVCVCVCVWMCVCVDVCVLHVCGTFLWRGAELQPVRQAHTSTQSQMYRDNLGLLLLIDTNYNWNADCTGLVPSDPYMDDLFKVFVRCNDVVLSVSSCWNVLVTCLVSQWQEEHRFTASSWLMHCMLHLSHLHTRVFFLLVVTLVPPCVLLDYFYQGCSCAFYFSAWQSEIFSTTVGRYFPNFWIPITMAHEIVV